MNYELTTLTSKSGKTQYPAITIMHHTFKFQSAKQAKLFIQNVTPASLIESQSQGKKVVLIADGVSYGRFSRKQFTQLKGLFHDNSQLDQPPQQYNSTVEIAELSTEQRIADYSEAECRSVTAEIDHYYPEVSYEYLDVDSCSELPSGSYQGDESSEAGTLVHGSEYSVSYHAIEESDADRAMRAVCTEEEYELAVGIREYKRRVRELQESGRRQRGYVDQCIGYIETIHRSNETKRGYIETINRNLETIRRNHQAITGGNTTIEGCP